MANDIYDIDFKKITLWWVPFPLRDYILLTYLGVVIYPVAQIHQFFLRFKTAKLYQLKITPQVCYLEMMLNDLFDFTSRRIRIADAIWYLPTYLYQEPELKPLTLYTPVENNPVYLYQEGEVGEYKDDFVVFVPAAIIFNMAQMQGSLDTYKLAGTRFKIQIVN